MPIQIGGFSVDLEQTFKILFILMNLFLFYSLLTNFFGTIDSYNDMFFKEANPQFCDLTTLSAFTIQKNIDQNNIIAQLTGAVIDGFNLVVSLINFIVVLLGCLIANFKFILGLLILIIDGYMLVRVFNEVTDFFNISVF